MIFNLVLTSRGWLQERLDDFHPRLGANDAPPIFLRSSRFIIHTFMRRYTDLCIKILTGNTVSREFHESRHRRVNCKRLTKCICNTISSLYRKWASVRDLFGSLWKINDKYVGRFTENGNCSSCRRLSSEQQYRDYSRKI